MKERAVSVYLRRFFIFSPVNPNRPDCLPQISGRCLNFEDNQLNKPLYTQPSDTADDLMLRFRAGEEAAFTEVYDRFYFELFQYARRWLREPSDAEDVTAETFIKLLQHRSRFENLANIEGFLKITVRNACFNNLKHRKVRADKQDDLLHQLSPEQEPDFGWVKAEEDFLTIIYAEVEKLPEKMKEVFLLSFKDGLKPAEISALLGIKVRTVSNQKTNAIQLLKAALEQHPHLLVFLFLFEI